MLLAIDIGNSNVKFALFEGETKKAFWRLATIRQRTVDEYTIFLSQTFTQREISLASVTGVILSSVVPEATPHIQAAVTRLFGIAPMMVGELLDRLPFQCLVDRPQDIGSDRLAAIAAARSLYPLPALIVDFGTATTFTLIDADGNYRGGAIAPGVNTSLDALCAKAAKLPQIALKRPPSIWAKNTVHAIQSGSVFGTIAMVDGMIGLLTAEFEPFASVILSGGLSSFFKNEIKGMTQCNPSLNLTGLRLIHQLVSQK